MAFRSSFLTLALLATPLATSSAQAPASPAPPLHIDPASPANAGRLQLSRYLDGIAARSAATRRESIGRITTRSAAENRQRAVRARFLQLMGGLPQRTPLNARSLGWTQLPGFRVEKILFDSQPDFPVTALLYLPDSPAGQGSATSRPKFPAIVMAPGHSPAGKAGDFPFAAAFARAGIAVLSYDPIGQGERFQYPDPANPGHTLAKAPTGEHGEAGLQPTLIGAAVARFFAWDGVRAIDFLQSRPEIDPNRIGAFGCSGGGSMTALLSAVDQRLQAIGTACYITDFDHLLPAIGPQDAEQSMPNLLASGPGDITLDFADWVELAAPTPYAVISTTEDMFPFAGARSSVTEARRFYSLFAAGPNRAIGATEAVPSASHPPSAARLNPDSTTPISATAPLQWITGPGRHGNLRPILPEIIAFFTTNLHPDPAYAASSGASAAPAQAPPKEALQVTPTGQVLTSFPNAATVHSLTLAEARRTLRPELCPCPDLPARIRAVTHASAIPGAPSPTSNPVAEHLPNGISHRLKVHTEDGIDMDAEFYRPSTPGKHPTILYLRSTLDPSLDETARRDDIAHLHALAKAGNAVFAITPRPSPPGTEESKAPILGDFYLTELRSELVGKTLLGMRVDDVIRAIDFLSTGETEDPNNITAVASGHLGLVLIHAAVLDPRLKHITVDHTLESYASLLQAPMPLDAPQDILPGVLLYYDIPDLVRALGPRVTFADPLPGTANLASKP